MTRIRPALVRSLILLGMLENAAICPALRAQDAAPSGVQGILSAGPDNWSIFTQATYIDQWHQGFPAAYSGPNSFRDTAEVEHTFSFSLFLDRKIWEGCELVYNPEFFQGHGLSQTLGIAGFPNGEAVKSGYVNLHYNTSRLFLRQVVGLGGAREKLDRDVNQAAESVDVDRLTFSVGVFSADDFFDGNAYSHDPRTQFMNWAMWESAAWDYPANVVGFIPGGVVEWNTESTTLHYGFFMETREPNSAPLDWHVLKAHGQILQLDYRYKWDSRGGTVRPFVYWNQADMGSFKLSTEAAAAGGNPADTAGTRANRSKVGFGMSWDQELAPDLGGFIRLSWDDGRTEDWNFTQVDRSVAAGLSLKGGAWKRADDVLGAAIAVNGLSREQRDYLAAGGTGLIIGDGALSYRTEQILESYYAFQPVKWLQVSLDFQYIRNPAYNSDRGPVPVYAVRAHVQF